MLVMASIFLSTCTEIPTIRFKIILIWNKFFNQTIANLMALNVMTRAMIEHIHLIKNILEYDTNRIISAWIH